MTEKELSETAFSWFLQHYDALAAIGTAFTMAMAIRYSGGCFEYAQPSVSNNDCKEHDGLFLTLHLISFKGLEPRESAYRYRRTARPIQRRTRPGLRR